MLSQLGRISAVATASSLARSCASPPADASRAPAPAAARSHSGIVQSYLEWADQPAPTPEVARFTQELVAADEHVRIDDVVNRKFGVRSIRGHAITDTLANSPAGALPFYQMYMKRDGSEVLLVVCCGEGTTGHPGVVHGGITSLFFDNTLGWTHAVSLLKASNTLEAFTSPAADSTAVTTTKTTETFGFTAYLHVNYRKPWMQGQPAVMRAKVVKSDGRKQWLNGTLETLDGRLIADAESLYIRPRPQHK